MVRSFNSHRQSQRISCVCVVLATGGNHRLITSSTAPSHSVPGASSHWTVARQPSPTRYFPKRKLPTVSGTRQLESVISVCVSRDSTRYDDWPQRLCVCLVLATDWPDSGREAGKHCIRENSVLALQPGVPSTWSDCPTITVGLG